MIIPLGTRSELARFRILVLATNAPGLQDLDHLGVGSVLEKLSHETNIWADALVGNVTVEDLSDALLAVEYDVFQCDTHGDRDSIAIGREFLSGAQLSRLLSQHNLKAALLLSCDSEAFTESVAKAGVPFVVAVRSLGERGLSNELARLFSREFYKHLVRYGDPPQACDYALSRLPDDAARAFFVVCRGDQVPDVRDLLEQVLLRLDQVDDHVEQGMQTVLEAVGVSRKSLRASNREVIRAVLALAGVMSNGNNGKDDTGAGEDR